MTGFSWVKLNEVSDDVLKDFNCGVDAYNLFLHENARSWMTEGYAVTYVAVDEEELKQSSINHIFAYAAISTTGLLTKEEKSRYLSCAEIRLFAVSKALRGSEAVDSDGVRYSYKIFQSLMQELYYISTHVIGFTAVMLNANDKGLSLYKKFGFFEISEYISPEDEDKLDIEGCKALMFSLKSSDVLEKLFL